MESQIRITIIQRLGSRFMSGFFFLIIGAVALMMWQGMTRTVPPEDLAIYLAGGLFLVLSVFIAFTLGRSGTINLEIPAYAVSLIVWSFLLVDDSIFFFNRKVDMNAVARSSFSSSAYGEVMIWVIAALVLAILSIPWLPRLTRTLFTGQHRWLTLYVLVCIGSTAWSQGKGYSLAWAFKLTLALWTLYFCAIFIRTTGELGYILRASLIMLSLALLASVLAGIIDPDSAFIGGRLAGINDPTGLSEQSGLAFLLTLILYTWKRSTWLLFPGLLSAATMLLGGGKASICATVVGATFFLLLTKRSRLILLLWSGIGSLLLIVLLTTSTGQYMERYASSDQGSTLTGRTELWRAALPEAAKRIFFGHGYMGSRYFTLLQSGPVWASHMHNAFLETLYNNGLAGLVLILIICGSVVRNVYLVRRKGTAEMSLLAAGFLAIFINLQIDGLFRPTFGGKANSFFVLFIAVAVLTSLLRKIGASDCAGNGTLRFEIGRKEGR